MKITVFTSNQSRHLSLLRELAAVADEVYAVQECTTVFPGEVDDFFRKSNVMQDYFARVITAERELFGALAFLPSNVRSLSIRVGDISRVSLDVLAPALQSDIYVVFGASYIKRPLIDFLVGRRALNIHMGVSPYYRGDSCNFWAVYDGNPDLVGATIHYLSAGLDTGAILYHALPAPAAVDPFSLGMRAVKAAHRSFTAKLADGSLWDLTPVEQNKSFEIRYSRNSDFVDAVAAEYLARNLKSDDVAAMLAAAPSRDLLRPHYIET